MATIRLAPLVSTISGKTAGVVFSRWKGRPYVRKLVTPHNPQSDDQMTVRNSLARMVYLYRTMPAQLQDWLDLCAADDRMSGYNLFMKQCRAREQAEENLLLAPYNTDIEQALTFAAATGGGLTKEIDLTWTGGTLGGDYKVYLLLREVIDPDGEGYQLWDETFILQIEDLTLFSAGSLTITAPKADTDYELYLMNELATTHEFSMSMADTATSKA